MEFILEVVFELIFEGIEEISTNKKISKWIRYPLIVVIVAFYLLLIGLFFALGVDMFSENKLGSLLMIALAIFMFVICAVAFRKLYLKKNKRG